MGRYPNNERDDEMRQELIPQESRQGIPDVPSVKQSLSQTPEALTS